MKFTSVITTPYIISGGPNGLTQEKGLMDPFFGWTTTPLSTPHPTFNFIGYDYYLSLVIFGEPYLTVDYFYDAMDYVPYDDVDYKVPYGLLNE